MVTRDQLLKLQEMKHSGMVRYLRKKGGDIIECKVLDFTQEFTKIVVSIDGVLETLKIDDIDNI